MQLAARFWWTSEAEWQKVLERECWNKPDWIMNLRIVLAALFATTVSSFAHPGHDLMAHGPAHVATSAYHLWVLVGTAVAAFGIAQIVRTKRARNIMRAAGVTALAVAAVLWRVSS